ncbi:hypothetical protein BD324DRAFT_653168 [Kockovaella imperatae]|uniref:Uncharacterized protein n=1 Tax=Kockovaella imperatae TaxID=4999 RepID=A0A1Y1U8M3_9TREE|nr:hypothetical protein BD324DRAFT_653168 [Kockovaella imperatae]ORX34391.1 hypothetical protein BD324DRAFT_653168 [Kockovaella imperatae]
MGLFKALPRHLALSRLKSNLFLLLLSLIFRTVFTPYLALRRATLWLLSEPMGSKRASYTLWLLETALTAIFVWNSAEAAYCLHFPAPVPKTPSVPAGKTFTPIARSSPLTRAYASSPSKAGPSTPSHQLTTTPSRLNSTPSQPSPLSLPFGTPRTGTPSRTGLFYETDARASPSKIAQSGSADRAQDQPSQNVVSVPSSTGGGDFVMVEREEKEWVDNVWKGVRGKGGGKKGP